MARRAEGWRTGAGAIAPRAGARGGSSRASDTTWPGTEPGLLTAQFWQELRWLKRVDWSVAFVGFLAYIFAFTTFQLPVGDIGIGLALLAVAFRRPRFTSLQLWLAIFTLWAALGVVHSAFPDIVQAEVIFFGKLWLIILVAVNAIRSFRQLRVFMVFFLGCFVTHPAIGAIRNHFSGDFYYYRAAWNQIFENPNDLAALALLQLSMAAGLLAVERKGPVRVGAWVACGVLVLLVLLTQSRGAFLALMFFGILTLRGRIKAKALVPVALVGIIAIVFAPPELWDRLTGLTNLSSVQVEEDFRNVDPEGSAEARWHILRVATKIAKEHPATGTGLGTYMVTHAQYARRDPRVPWIARGHRDTHNTFLNVLVETGVPGLGIFLTLVGTTLYQSVRARRRIRRFDRRLARLLFFLEAGLLSFLLAGVFGSFAKLSFLHVHLALMLVVSSLVSRVALRRRAALVSPPPSSSGVPPVQPVG